MTDSPQALALYARAQLDAAQKHSRDCEERQTETLTTYIGAMEATAKAYERERDALTAWFNASRPAIANSTTNAEEPAP